MAFEADHNRAALSQECAIVLRRTDFDSLGWLTVSGRSVVAGRVARWLAGCPNAPASVCCVLLFGRVVDARGRAIRDSELAQAKTPLYS